MRIVLNEPPDPRQTGQSTRSLVPVDDTELGHPDWKLFITAVSSVEDDTVTRAVHRFQRKLFFLDVECEHVVSVVLPMAGCFPEFTIVHVGGDDWASSVMLHRKNGGWYLPDIRVLSIRPRARDEPHSEKMQRKTRTRSNSMSLL
jgi:hypothetical protein